MRSNEMVFRQCSRRGPRQIRPECGRAFRDCICRGVFLVVALALCALTPVSQARAGEREQLRASFVLKFLGYVSFRTPPTETLPLCVMGTDADTSPFRAFQGRDLDGATIDVRVNPDRSTVQRCYVMYFATRSSELLSAVKNHEMLTIGLGSDFLNEGGIIALLEVEQKIRFEVSTDAAERARLSLDSRLLQLATVRR